MEAYTGFAEVYDLFMDNIPYEEWGTYVKGLLKEYGVDEGLVLELGCGTGTMTEILASAGYDMIGIDQSEEMLEEALEKNETMLSHVSSYNIRYGMEQAKLEKNIQEVEAEMSRIIHAS